MLQKVDNRITYTAESTDPVEQAFKSGLTIRWVAILEIALFLLIAGIVDVVYMDGSRFMDVEPHPFWLLVVVISLQYGAGEGLLAAVAASAYILFFNLPAQPLSQDNYDYAFSLGFQPFLWAVAALVIGGIRSRQLKERSFLQRNVEKLSHERETVGAAFQDLQQRHMTLQARLGSRQDLSNHAFKLARVLEGRVGDDLIAAAGESIRELLAPQSLSFFTLDGQRLKCAATWGWRDTNVYDRFFTVNSEIYQAIVENRSFLSATDAPNAGLLRGQGVLAGPLFDADSERVVGMMKIEEIDFMALNEETLEKFKILCGWLATIFAKQRTKALPKPGRTANRLRILSGDLLRQRIHMLQGIAERGNVDLSVVALELEPMLIGDLTSQDRTRLILALNSALEKLRKIDGAFFHGTNANTFVVLLPTTNGEGAARVASKIKLLIKRSLPDEIKAIPLKTRIVALSSLLDEKK